MIPSALISISPATSNVKVPASDIVEPLIVMSSTVRVVKVPKLVIFGCAAVVTVAAVPEDVLAQPFRPRELARARPHIRHANDRASYLARWQVVGRVSNQPSHPCTSTSTCPVPSETSGPKSG